MNPQRLRYALNHDIYAPYLPQTPDKPVFCKTARTRAQESSHLFLPAFFFSTGLQGITKLGIKVDMIPEGTFYVWADLSDCLLYTSPSPRD